MSEITRNSWSKGRQADVDPSVVANDSYQEAHNVTLTGDSKFLALENIKGTELIGTVYAATVNVLKVFNNSYLISGVQTPCLTVFASDTNTLDIHCYNPATATSYHLFRQTISGYAALNPVIDGYSYPEQGIDVLYFTDGINEMRKLRCDLTGYSPEFLSESDLSLQRLQPNGKVSLSGVVDGGTLLCGTYVASHRLVNVDKNVYSKWSPFTSPVHVNQTDLAAAVPYLAAGAYNSVSSQKIELTVSVTTDENTEYTHYQIGVIQRNTASTALTLDIQAIQDLTGATSYNYTFRENIKIDSIDLSDVVVDDAAIQAVKTISIKNNKLFAGNVTYHNLEFDNGTPEVASGSIVKQEQTSPASKEAFAHPYMGSTHKGYFRDEVYRFGIVYFDKYGNYSKVQVLDMTNVTANTSTQASFKDMKFPSRRNPTYHVFGTNLQSLGLSLTVQNHPSWAKGFIIVRANRKKNIVTQTPLLDCSELNGIEVIGEYPLRSLDKPIASTPETDHADATPMNPLGTLAPKNLLWTKNRHIVKSVTDNTVKQTGEVFWGTDLSVVGQGQVGSPGLYACIFPQTDIYEGGGFDNKEYKWEITDYAWLRLKKESATTGSYDDGTSKFTEVHGTFYADAAGDYYCSANILDLTAPPASGTAGATGKIEDYKLIDNTSPGTTIGSYFFQNYNNLITGGFTDYIPPTSQRMGVAKLDYDRIDITEYAVGGTYGTLVAPSGDEIPAGFFNGNPANIYTNSLSYELAAYSESTQYANLVEIVNITNGLTDDRYGDINNLHEFVSTGTTYILSDAEVSGNTAITVNVFGGDCFVSLHSFKVTDNYFGVANNEKYSSSTQTELQVAARWGVSFDTGTSVANTPISWPVPFKTCSTVLSVVLESEYNGATTSKAPTGYSDSTNGFKIPFSTEKGTWKIPFAYGYNANYNLGNVEKIFLPPYDGQLNIETLKARIIYSDQKVYQTGVSGFDRIRVSNILDMDETYGGITKLALAGDDMVAVQERATAYLPVDSATTETTDGTTLSIRSSEVIGLPTYISRSYGSQHLPSVLQADRTIFFVDNLNQLVVRFADRGLELISEKGGVKTFNTWLSSSIDPDNIVTCYDFVRKQAWFIGTSNCEIWDDRLGVWVGEYDFPTLTIPLQVINTNYSGENHLVLLATLSGGNLLAYNMYEGDYSSLLGVAVTPSVTFAVNEKYEVVKTFDNFIVYSTEKMDTITIVAEKEFGVVGNEVSGIDIDKDRREGNYRVQVPYDVDRARIRGVRASVTAYWKTSNLRTTLSSIITKFRISKQIL